MFLGRLYRETETLKKNAHARTSARAVAQTHFLLATHACRTCARKRASTKCSFVTTGRETATLNYGAGSWRGVGARRHREADWLSRTQESRGRRHGSGEAGGTDGITDYKLDGNYPRCATGRFQTYREGVRTRGGGWRSQGCPESWVSRPVGGCGRVQWKRHGN